MIEQYNSSVFDRRQKPIKFETADLENMKIHQLDMLIFPHFLLSLISVQDN